MTSIDVIEEIRKSQSTKYHRGKSWEHCYAFFRSHRKFSNNEKLLDLAALHLGFFLASWGMLRGSSFLLKKDYKFYIPIVKILTDSKYNRLWDINFLNESKKQDRDIDLLFQLKDELGRKISENNIADGDKEKHQMDLIITKIIMVTMGCIPAYDRYFKNGLKNSYQKKKNKKYINFDDPKSFKNLLGLIKSNGLEKIFKKSCSIKGTDIKYPSMKLLDLYFWLSGWVKETGK